MKTIIQCGYEDKCKHQNCIKCRRGIQDIKLKLNLAQRIVIEDFAVTDIKTMFDEGKEDELELMQDIMEQIMYKMFKEEKK